MSEATEGTSMKTNGKIPPKKPGQKRRFTTEFKKQVQARIKGGETLSDVAAELDINDSVVRRWSRGEGMGPMGGNHDRKWSPAQRKKFLHTRRKMVKAKLNPTEKRAYRRVDEKSTHFAAVPPQVKTAIGWLKHAQTWMYVSLQTGVITEFDEAHDYARQALRELQKLLEK